MDGPYPWDFKEPPYINNSIFVVTPKPVFVMGKLSLLNCWNHIIHDLQQTDHQVRWGVCSLVEGKQTEKGFWHFLHDVDNVIVNIRRDFPLNRGLFVDTSGYVTLKSFP